MTTQTVVQSNTPPLADQILADQNGWPARGQWRYADYLRLPDDSKRYEIIEGVLYVANAPSVEHQYTAFKIAFYLELFVQQKNLGMVLMAPIEVHLAEDTKPVQPDVLLLKTEQMPLLGSKVIVGPPALIVEVISPSSIRLDRHIKFDVYERYGVAEYWLVDPKARLVEVYTWARGEYALFGQYTGDDVVMSKLLEGLQIKASLLFQPNL
jgi:Uma2 family endonuclease